MIKNTDSKSLKKLAARKLDRLMSDLDSAHSRAVYEYHRRQAMHIKEVDPQYYETHFKKHYG
jgi:hypothetical protein